MSDTLRVILEIGKKRRVVAGAMDWPGLDRWGTSEDDALARLHRVLPRYAAVADRAGWGRRSTDARDVEVVERVPGSSSTDFWGIAHVPSQIEREVLPSRRPGASARPPARLLGLLRRGGGPRLARASTRHPQRRAQPRPDHPPRVHQRAGADVAQGGGPHAARGRPDAGRPGGTPPGVPRRHPRLQRRGQGRPGAGRIQFLVRRTAHHLMDHAWEMEDRDPTPA